MAEVARASQSSGVDMNIRVEDYLNDQLQTDADLENVDALLENVQKQHTLLREQVRGHTARIIYDLTDDLSASRGRIDAGWIDQNL
jgi:uncharacterized protein HemY